MNNNFNLENAQNMGLNEAKEYIIKYFIPLTDGNIAQLINGEYEVKESAIIKSTYFARLSKEINDYFFKQYPKIRSIVYQLNKEVLFDDKLNLCPQMKFKYSEYKLFSDDIKKNVDIVLNYIFEIWCSSKKDMFDFILKWLANVMKGKKNQSCLYLKGIQGLGKSTPLLFIKTHILKKLYLETGSTPLVKDFNLILGGKTLVVFEELETFSSQQWSAVSSRLKRYITSDTMVFEGKGTNSYDGENLNNYIILANDALKEDEGRRICTLDISTHRHEDRVYHGNFYNNCMNDKVGEAFYCYLLEMDTEKFNSQVYPNTLNKLDSFAQRAHNVYQYLKDEYVLNKKNLYGTVDDIHSEYKLYCGTKGFKVHHKIDFNKKMKEINILHYVSSSKNKYKVPYETLLAVAEKFHWIHTLDEFENNEVQQMENGTEEIIRKQALEIEALKKQLDGYKVMQLTTEPVLDGDDISAITESTTASKTKTCVKFKSDRLIGMTDTEIISYLTEDRINKFSTAGKQQACDTLKDCEKRLKEKPKRVYSWKDTEDCVTRQEQIDCLRDAYNEYCDNSKSKIDQIISELEEGIKKTNAYACGDTESIKSYESCQSNASSVPIKKPIHIKKSFVKGYISKQEDKAVQEIVEFSFD